MVFSSFTFLLFLLPALAGFHLLCHAGKGERAMLWLLICSWLFYAWWKPVFLLVLWASILANWYVAGRVEGARSAAWLVLGIGANLCLLATFKHSGWLARLANDYAGASLSVQKLALPLGLSFVTFQQISRLVDIYRGRGGQGSLAWHALFVSFFPQLIAGPIVRYGELVPQLKEAVASRVDWRRISEGVLLFSIGLLKKLVLADPLAGMVDPLFSHPADLGLYESWTAALAYAFQLYFDFSGYCDMAAGIARMFGVVLPWNFDSPYRSGSIVEFWRRWHITLGAFLRDYLYFPLGGGRKGRARQVLVLLLVMALAGLWHGAGGTFLVWGLYHGVLLSACHLWRQTGRRVPAPLAWASTFLAVVAGWVVFRARTLADAWQILEAMGGAHGARIQYCWRSLLPFLPDGSFSSSPWLNGMELPILVLLAGIVLSRSNSRILCERFHPTVGTWLLTTGAYLVAIVLLGQPSPFIYFDF